MQIGRRQFIAASFALAAVGRAWPAAGSRRHFALLGDSVFDNAAYVDAGAEVIAQLRRRLSSGEQATLMAKDGARIADVPLQLTRLPRDVTHLILSIGGNDALDRAGVLDATEMDAPEAFRALADIIEIFEESYRRMLKVALKTRLPLAVCTIYNGYFDDRDYQRRAAAAVAALDDAIVRCAAGHGITVIDLRHVCAEAFDFTHQVEPSGQGGAKIADVILRAFVESKDGVRIIA